MRRLNRRHLALLAIVILLALINAWRWIFPARTPAKTGGGSEAAREFQPEDFRINGLSARTDIGERADRDLFLPKVAVVKPAIKKAEPKPEPPPKTPEQLEEEAARAELAQIKCVGVAFRAHKGQAFLVKGDQVYIAFVGDRVGSRFVVEEIAPDSVHLKDPKTNVSAQLSISGG